MQTTQLGKLHPKVMRLREIVGDVLDVKTDIAVSRRHENTSVQVNRLPLSVQRSLKHNLEAKGFEVVRLGRSFNVSWRYV